MSLEQLVKQQNVSERPPSELDIGSQPHDPAQQEPVPVQAPPQSLINNRFPHALSSQTQQARLSVEVPQLLSGAAGVGSPPPALGGPAPLAPPPVALPPYGPPVPLLMPQQENIGTKEQRKERKRKLNVAELFHKKRSRLEDKSASPSPTRVRNTDKKMANPHSPLMGGAGLMGGSVVKLEPGSLSSAAHNAGPILGTDPMYPADPLKVEGGLLSPLDVMLPKNVDRKKRKRIKKRKEGTVKIERRSTAM